MLKIFYLNVLELFSQKLNYFYIKSEIRLLILLSAYSFFNVDNYYYVLPIVLYYITYILMVLTTCQMLQNQKDFQEYRLWSSLFMLFRWPFKWRSSGTTICIIILKPYGHFVLSKILQENQMKGNLLVTPNNRFVLRCKLGKMKSWIFLVRYVWRFQ